LWRFLINCENLIRFLRHPRAKSDLIITTFGR
jgi:hypothetical protein